MKEVPRLTLLAPLAPSCFVLCLIGVETEGLFEYQVTAAIISIVLSMRKKKDKHPKIGGGN